MLSGAHHCEKDNTFGGTSEDDQCGILNIHAVPCQSSASQPSDGIASKLTAVLSKISNKADDATWSSGEPAFTITSKISSRYAPGPSCSVAGESGSPNSDQRPRLYRVRRTLSQLVWFRDLMIDKVPYCVTVELPTKDDASTLSGADRVIAMLFIFSSCPELKEDPLFWCLLTQPDEEFEEQYRNLRQSDGRGEALQRIAKKALAVTLHHRRGTTTRVRGGAPVHLNLTLSKLPQKDLKPTKISDMLMETGVIDRALVTLDKISECVGASYYFEGVVDANEQRTVAWQEATDAIHHLRGAMKDELCSMRDVATSLRELAFPSYWPWSREAALAEDGPRDATLPPVRPPPSQRLTHYLHRTSNACLEVGRLSNNVYGDDFSVSTGLYNAVVASRSFSADVAHHRLHSNEFGPRPKGRNLSGIQDEFLVLVGDGRGHDALDELDAMDDELSCIHDAVDDAVTTFEGHNDAAALIMGSKMLREIKELIVGQDVCWRGAILLLADLKTTLDLDSFLDDEPLPFTNAPVVHNPSATQKQKFEEHQHRWGTQIVEFIKQQQDSQSEVAAVGTDGATALKTFFSKPLLHKKQKRSALKMVERDEDGNEVENPFEAEYQEMDQWKSPNAQPLHADPQAFPPQTFTSPQDVLPDDLRAVIEKQSQTFLLDKDCSPEANSSATEELFEEESDNKRKGMWQKKHATPSRWGAIQNEEDPFQW